MVLERGSIPKENPGHKQFCSRAALLDDLVESCSFLDRFCSNMGTLLLDSTLSAWVDSFDLVRHRFDQKAYW